MLAAQNIKTVNLVSATVSTIATASAKVDRFGFDYAMIDVQMPKATATDSSAKWAVLEIDHGDTTAISQATAITALVGSTNTSVTSGFVIQPNNDTSNPQIHRFFVDCRGKGRYLFVKYQGAASHQTANIVADLLRPQQGIKTDSQRGSNLTSIFG